MMMDKMFSTILFGQCILVSFMLTGLVRRFQRSKASSNINDSLVMFLFINMSLAQVCKNRSSKTFGTYGGIQKFLFSNAIYSLV